MEEDDLDPGQFIVASQRQAASAVIDSLDDNPDEAARAQELSRATGTPPALVYSDLPGYEKQHKTALSAELLRSNEFLTDYVNSHPLAAKISGDDYGQLDTVTSVIGKLFKIDHAATRGFAEGFGKLDELGGWVYGSNNQYAEFVKNNRGIAALASTLGMPIEIFGRVFTGALGAVKEGLTEATGDPRLARELTGAIEMELMGLGGRGMGAIGQHAPEIQKVVRASEPYVAAGKEPPPGVHPALDEMKVQTNAEEVKGLLEAVKESQASATRERAPALFADFVRPQIKDAKVGISADAVRELYGDKVPAEGDGLLGWVPGLKEQLAVAEATGGDVKVPVAELLANGDPAVIRGLKDDIRVRDAGITANEAELFKPAPTGEVLDLYHGTTEGGFESLSANFAKNKYEKAIFLSDKPEAAAGYAEGAGGRMFKTGIEKDKLYAPTEAELNDFAAKGDFVQQALDKSKELGLAGVHFNLDGTNVFAVHDPAQLLSPYRTVRQAAALEPLLEKVPVKEPKAPTQLELEGLTRLEDREVFAKANAIGMTVKQYRRYQELIERRATEDAEALQAKAEAYQKRAQTKEWKEAERETRASVEKEFNERPDVLADRFFTDGELYGDKLAQKPKLATEFLTEEQRAKLPKTYLAKDGLHPDDAANLLGYNTGADLVDRLAIYNENRLRAGMTPKDYAARLIDIETEQRMQERFGDLGENILREAKDQVISQTQADILHEEVLALGLRAGTEFSITKEQLQSWVREKFAGLKLSEVSTDKFLQSAGKAGRAAELHLLGDKPADAFKEKQRQYLAMLMANEAKKLEKAQGQFDRLADRMAKREPTGVLPEYTNWAHDILMRVGKPVRRSIQDLQDAIGRAEHKTLEDFVDSKETHGMREVPVAEFLYDPSFRKSMDNLTVEEFRAINDSVKTLVKNGRDELKIFKAGEEADLKEVKGKLIEQLETFKEKHYDANGKRWLGPIPPAVAKPIRTYLASHLQLESIFNRWDRGDPKGNFTQYVMRDLSQAANYESALERKFSRMLVEAADKASMKEYVDNPIFDNPLDGTKMRLTRGNLRAILLNAGNEGNLKKMALGYKLKPEQVMQWLHLNATKEDWAWAQKIGDIFKEIKKDADVMQENLSGVPAPNVDIKLIDTPHGQFEGWYYPLIKHPTFEGKSRKLMGPDALEQNNYNRATTPQGYTKDRTGAIYPLALDIDMMPVRMRQMLHDIAMRPAVVNASKIFYDADVRSAIAKHYGAEYRELLIPYLRDVANAANYRSDAQHVGVQTSEFIRQNMIATLIGLNPGTVLKHGPTAAINSLTEVGPINFLRAAKGLFSINEATGETNWAFAMRTSEELQRRRRNYNETLGGAQDKMLGQQSLRETVVELGSTPVALSDLLSAVPTWLAQYEKTMGEGRPHGDGVFMGDRAVRRAHGSTAVTNRPGIVRGSGALGSWLASLYGFFNHIMNRQYELVWKAGDTLGMVKEGEYKKAMAMTPGLTAGLFSYILFPALIEELVTPLGDDKKESWGVKAAKGLTFTVSSSWIGIRDIAAAALHGRDPTVGLLTTTAKTGTDLFRDLSKDRPLSKEKAGSIIQHGATFMGALTGLTNAQEGKAAKFIYNYNQGLEPKPKGPWGWATGLRFGTLKKHPGTAEEWFKHHFAH